MLRFDRSILGVMVLTVMTGCMSTPEGENVGVSKEELNPQGAMPRPPQTGSTAQLAAPPASTIDANGAKAALGDRNVRAKLRDVALEASSRHGVGRPMKIHAVAASDHQSAETLLSGATVNDHAPVYVITMTGGPFTAMHHPPGAPAPQGNVLTVTVDAATNRVTDIGLVDAEPDLSQLDTTPVDLNTP
jgi:hypothetical protein